MDQFSKAIEEFQAPDREIPDILPFFILGVDSCSTDYAELKNAADRADYSDECPP